MYDMLKCEHSIQKLENGTRLIIAALGDSLTFGWMVQEGFIDILDKMLREKYPNADFTIINRGLPGGTAQEGIFRMQRQIIDEHPDLVTVQFGLNDALSGYSPEDFYNNMKHIVNTLQKDTRAEILLMTSPLIYDEDMMRLARPYYDKIVKLADEEALPAARVDRYWEKKISAGVNHASLVQSDMAHPTEAGHRLMAEAVMELF
jgi:lysophospholipase L1-like esterase